MRKIVVVITVCFCLAMLTGCSQETQDKAANIYNDLVDLGKDIYNEVDSAVDAHTTPSAGSEADENFDAFAAKLDELSRSYTVKGDDVVSVISGIKSTDLTVLIQRQGDSQATVLGKLLTSDNTGYVEGVNDLISIDGVYSYDFCSMNGIIPSAIPTMANRKFEVHRYDTQALNIMDFADVTAEQTFHVLNLYENKVLVGFYFYED